MNYKNILPLILSLILGTQLMAQEAYIVVVNPANSIESISKSDVSKIFQKKITKFENGLASNPVDQRIESEARIAFTDEILGKSISNIKNYWSQQMFSGGSIAPKELKSDEEVIAFVTNNPGAIGYLSSTADVSQVKVIKIQ